MENKTKNIQLTIDFLWVPKHLGGHSGIPYVGMRLTARWQRHVEEFMRGAVDLECKSLEFDANTLQGTGRFVLRSVDMVPPEWLRDEELVELLSGYRVLAIGRISNSTDLPHA